MKPKIFLSHNKKDKDFIKQLADALRLARIDVWFDDWEIPAGASLRTKIFEEGIPGCDLFFVYLTENSINSSWVKQELDAAFVTELEDKGGFLALFVNNDEIRDQLPLDLRSRRIPTINHDNISESLLELVALAWETFSEKQVKRVKDNTRIGTLELEKKVLEKELEIEKLKSKATQDYSPIIQALESTIYEDSENNVSLAQTFYELRKKFARGIFETEIDEGLSNFIDVDSQDEFYKDVIANLVLHRLVIFNKNVRMHPYHSGDDKEYELTDLGKNILFELEKNYGNLDNKNNI
jgi:hypothetical protein